MEAHSAPPPIAFTSWSTPASGLAFTGMRFDLRKRNRWVQILKGRTAEGTKSLASEETSEGGGLITHFGRLEVNAFDAGFGLVTCYVGASSHPNGLDQQWFGRSRELQDMGDVLLLAGFLVRYVCLARAGRHCTGPH